MDVLLCLADGSVLRHLRGRMVPHEIEVRWTDEEGDRSDQFLFVARDDEGVAIYWQGASLQ